MKSIFKAVATVTIFSIITRALGFVFRIFISRKIGAEGLGLYQMATSILGIFMTLISSGLPLTTAKMVSKYETQNNISKRNKTVTTSLVISFILAIISSILIVCLKNVWGIILTDSRAVEIMIILIPSIVCSAIYAILRGGLWGQNDYFSCGLTELIEQIARFILTALLLISVSDIFSATKMTAIAFDLACFISALAVTIIYLKRNRLDFKKGEYKQIIKSSAPITGVRLATSFVQPLTTFIIPTMLVFSGFSRTEAVESFGVIMGMTFPLLFVPMTIIGSISMVLIPSISSMMAKNNVEDVKSNITQSVEVSIFISMLFIPLYLSIGDLIGIVLYNNVSSGILLQMSAICVLPICLCNLSGSILNALNLEVKSFVNYIIGSIVLIIGLVALTPLIGISSVIVSFFLSMTTISLLNFIKICKAIPNFKLDLIKTICKYSLIILPCSLLGHFVANIVNAIFGNFTSSIVGGSFSVLSTVLLCKMFSIFDVDKIKQIILKKRKK